MGGEEEGGGCCEEEKEDEEEVEEEEEEVVSRPMSERETPAAPQQRIANRRVNGLLGVANIE